MTIQEYKEKIVHTIEQMEMEHHIEVNGIWSYGQYDNEKLIRLWNMELMAK